MGIQSLRFNPTGPKANEWEGRWSNELKSKKIYFFANTNNINSCVLSMRQEFGSKQKGLDVHTDWVMITM